MNLAGRPLKSLPITTFSTRFFEVSYHWPILLADRRRSQLTCSLGTGVRLRNVIWTHSILCQIIITSTSSSPLLSRSTDKAFGIFWHSLHIYLLYDNRHHLCSSLCSSTRRKLAPSPFVFTLRQGYGHDLCSRDLQYCQRLLYLDTTDTSGMEITASFPQKDWTVRCFHDGAVVRTLHLGRKHL